MPNFLSWDVSARRIAWLVAFGVGGFLVGLKAATVIGGTYLFYPGVL